MWIVNVDEYLDSNDLVNIVNDTLSEKEQNQIFNKIESSTQSHQVNCADIKDDYDDISEIKEELCVDCSDF